MISKDEIEKVIKAYKANKNLTIGDIERMIGHEVTQVDMLEVSLAYIKGEAAEAQGEAAEAQGEAAVVSVRTSVDRKSLRVQISSAVNDDGRGVRADDYARAKRLADALHKDILSRYDSEWFAREFDHA